MTCFVMVMAMYPEKQALAKAELDQLLRGKRLPTIADRGSLPYIEAMIHETLRWHVALPASEFSPLNVRKFSISNAKFAGLPRRTAKADEYRGYHIPEGTIILPNVWCADPILFPVTMPSIENAQQVHCARRLRRQ
jgi:cytochrome P450